MADNNLARNRNDGPDFFADGDPLAELARIVGYDERLVPKPPVAERREPAFNLEDELLQEFERYDAPRPHQSAVDAVAMAEPETAPVAEEPVMEQSASEPAYGDSSRDETAELDWSAVEDAFSEGFPKVEAGTATVEPLLDLGAPQGAVEPINWNVDRADIVQPVEAVPVAASAEPLAAVDLTEPVNDVFVASEEPALDLADELELAIGEPEVRASEPAHQEPVLRSEHSKRSSYTPAFRMPLANFNTSREALRPAAEPKVEPAPAPRSSSAVAETAVRAEPQLEVPAAEPVEIAQAQNVSAQAPVVPSLDISSAPVARVSEFSALDDLISDVSRYPVPQSGSQPSFTDHREQVRLPAEEPAVSAVVAPIEAKAVPAKPSPAVAQPAEFAIDPMIDDDFELALDDLELDLSDIMSDDDLNAFAAPKPSAPPMASSEPVRHTATWSPIARFSPSQARATPVGPAISTVAAAPAVAALQPAPTVHPTPVAAQRPQAEPETISDLPFDAALIAESEEHLEPVVELDVPELHVEEQQVPVQRNDYDFDLDAELASLLQSTGPVSAGDEIEAAEQDPIPHQVAQPVAASSYPDLDDFERALEEDFRRSLTTPLPPQTHVGEAGARSAGRSFEGSRWSLSAMIVPLAVAGVVIAGGSIGYMILGGDGTSVASNGEPVVIAADTDPVKVLPENPGGKTVPNQDKAVYDRVAGAAMEAPKQESLISTSEEPIDVVQKTLMTDTLPMEGEFAGLSDDAKDDRLLPQDQAAGGAADQEQSVAVTPRRVKTMIVRPDGTLVEQEVPAEPAAVATANPSAPTDKVPAASVKTVEVASVPDAASQPLDTAQSGGTAGLVPVSTGAPDTVAPIAGTPAVGTPVPSARPAAAQSSNVVPAATEQGGMQPAPAAAEAPAPEAAAPATQVAAINPGDYVIQIASLPSEADAQKSYQNLSSKFGSVIGGRGVDIKQAQIEGKGTFYRVRIPAGSKADAVALCEKYRSAGGSCLVAR